MATYVQGVFCGLFKLNLSRRFLRLFRCQQTSPCEMLDNPVEVSLHVLSNFSFLQLRILPLVCRSWEAFIKVNETSIHRNAAFKAGFISSPDELLADAKKYARKVLQDVTGWKEYCQYTSI